METVALDPAELTDALVIIVGRSQRKALSLLMAARGGKFTVTDAANRATMAEIPCTGEWSGTAEVSGPQLRNAVKSLLDKDIVMLYRDNGFLTVTGGASKFKLHRTG